MKKIVLVTWLGGGNYGTSLQSFALHRKLEMLGYNVSFLPVLPKKYTFKNKIKCFLGMLGIDLQKIKHCFRSQHLTLKQQKLADFISNNYNICNPINSERQLNSLISRTDVFVTGSDQIWNTAFCFNPFFFLDFAGNAKRIAYASSIGLQDFPEDHKPLVKKLLSKFSYIGLRENTAVDIVSKLLDRKDIVQVLDPTFLLDSTEWGCMADKANIEIELPNKYILCYLIGNNPWYEEHLHKVVDKCGIKDVVIIPAAENETFTIKGAIVYEDAGPLEFVKLIKDASFVCTDSFHATAISLNFNKDFVEFLRFKDSDKVSQNSRIYDMLTHYQLMKRMFSDTNVEWNQKIEYAKINEQLQKDRERSVEYLINAIG